MAELICKILTAESDLESLAAEWRELQARVGRSPFSDYDWVLVWWNTIGKKELRQMHIVTARRDGKLVGVLPLTVVRRKNLRILQGAGHNVFYCLEILCEDLPQALALWKAARGSPHYDFADIRDVYNESLCYAALTASPFARKRDVVEAYYLNFEWKNSEDWIASLPSGVRRPLRRFERRLSEKHDFKFEICRQEPLPMEAIDRMIGLKAKWAHENNKYGLYSHEDFRPFFHQLLKLAAQQNRMLLCWLKCDDEIIAYILMFAFNNVLLGYLITHDPKWSKYSPGILVMKNAVSWAMDNGFRALDHRQGSGQYKHRYANKATHCAEFTFSGSVRGRIFEAWFIALRTMWRFAKGNRPEEVQTEPESED